MTSQAMILANALLTKGKKRQNTSSVHRLRGWDGGRGKELREKWLKTKDLHPVICSEDGNEHGNVYDQRTGFGSDDIDYPAEPLSKCKLLINLTSTTYIHKTIPPPPPNQNPISYSFPLTFFYYNSPQTRTQRPTTRNTPHPTSTPPTHSKTLVQTSASHSDALVSSVSAA